MKYIVALKYKINEDSEELLYETKLFEFNNKKDRSDFINDTKHLVEDILLSQIGEEE